MKRFWKRMVCTLMVFILAAGTCGSITATAEADTLTAEQRNAIAMLNHLTVLTQETNASKNSRLFMEQAYSSLINNTYPNSVDNRTLNQMTGLLDTMERYRMIGVKRDRLQYIYEQNQAQAIRSAIPNPLGMLSTVHSLTPARLVASIAYMAIDSIASYESASSQAEMQYLQDGWALDDEESEVLHESRKSTFSYMVKMVNDYGLPGELALTESTVEEFVYWKNNNNVVARIQFLESNQDIYQSYGGYWLTLADSYYNNGELQKCIEAIEKYESLGTRLFRWDYDYAQVLPLGIAAAAEVYPTEQYVEYASSHADTIINNTRNDNWALKYFAAQTYVDLYGKTSQKEYLQKAYDIELDNVNSLIADQRAKNETYIAKVVETQASKGATNSEKDQVKKYNQMLNEERKKELPPISESLVLNCDLLFAIADELQISDAAIIKADAILHPQGARLFLTEAVDDQYWFTKPESTADADIAVEYYGNAFIIPVSFVTPDAQITVTVKEKESQEALILTDWFIDSVKRETEGDINTYYALYRSDEGSKHSWQPEAEVTITVTPKPSDEAKTYTFSYTTESTKKQWYDYLKVWEGHKNEWYDYLKVWDNSVDFVRIR